MDTLTAVIAQGLGWCAMGANLLSYQVKSNRRLFLLQVLSSTLFCLQFFLLGALTGCFTVFVNIVRAAMLSEYNKNAWVRRKEWPFLLSIVYTVILILTWPGPAGLLTWAASVVSTFAFWTNNAGKIRIANLFCTNPFWIIYDFLVGSWGGVFSASFAMLSILISIVRFGWSSLIDPNSSFSGKTDENK